MSLPRFDFSDERQIAIEHVLWAARINRGPRATLADLGIAWPCPWAPTWHDVVVELITARREALAARAPLRRAA